MLRRLTLYALLSCALLALSFPASSMVGDSLGTSVAYAQKRAKKAETARKKKGFFKKLKQRAKIGVNSLRPVKDFKKFRRTQKQDGLGEALRRTRKSLVRRTKRPFEAGLKRARRAVLSKWEGGRRKLRAERLEPFENRFEKSRTRLDRIERAEQKIESYRTGQVERLERMERVVDGLSRRQDRLTPEERAEIAELFDVEALSSQVGEQRRGKLRTGIPEGPLGARARHTGGNSGKGKKRGQEQKQKVRDQLRTALRKQIARQKGLIKKVDGQATRMAKRKTTAKTKLDRSGLRLAAELVRAGAPVADIDGFQGVAPRALASSWPRNGKVREAVRDQITLAKAFADAAEPLQALGLLEQIDAFHNPKSGRSDRSKDVLKELGIDPNIEGGLSNSERGELTKVRSEIAKKAVDQLEAYRDGGLDGTELAQAIQRVKSKIPRRHLRARRKIGNGLKDHRKVLLARARSIVNTAAQNMKDARKNGEAYADSQRRRGFLGRRRGQRDEALVEKVIDETRADALQDMARAEIILDQLIELEQPLDAKTDLSSGGLEAAKKRRRTLMDHEDLGGLQKSIDRFYAKQRPHFDDMAAAQAEAQARAEATAGSGGG